MSDTDTEVRRESEGSRTGPVTSCLQLLYWGWSAYWSSTLHLMIWPESLDLGTTTLGSTASTYR